MSFSAASFQLYGNDGYDSHVVRFLLAYKNLAYSNIWVAAIDDELAQLNPYGTLPILIGRDVSLYEINIILEYLEERHQAYKLLPDTPKERAMTRTLAWRIQQDWLKLGRILLTHTDSIHQATKDNTQKALTDTLTTLAPLFGQKPYFLSDKLGWCDVLLAPFLWRLPSMGVDLPKHLCRPLFEYQARLFAHPSFQASLSTPNPKTHSKANHTNTTRLYQEDNDDDF